MQESQVAVQVCVDASIVIKLFLPEPDSDRAERLVRAWQRQGVDKVAPPLLTYEVASTLYENVRGQSITAAQGQAALALLRAQRYALFQPDALHELAWELAHRCGQMVLYDSYYLALAAALDCEYWTADERYYRAAAPHSTRMRWLGNFDR